MKSQSKKLGEITTVITKGTTPTTLGFSFQNHGINFIKVESLTEDGRFLHDKFTYIDENCNLALRRSIILEDDILISIAGAIGRSVFVTSKVLPANTNQALAIVRPDPKILIPKYLYYYTRSLHFQKQVQGSIVQAAQPNISLGTLKNVVVILPSLSIQQQIAEILSAYDDLIENNLRRIKLLEEAARCRYKLMMEEANLWYEKRADEVCDIRIGKTPPREQEQWFNPEQDGVKWISIKDINNSFVFIQKTSETVTQEAVRKFNMNNAPKGTVILSFKLTVGKVAITTEDMVTNEAIAHFNIIGANGVSTPYLYFFLREFPFDSLGSTSSIGNAINSKVVKSMSIKIPPSDILIEFNRQVEPYLYLINNLITQNDRLREARDILLPRLMSGEIDVTSVAAHHFEPKTLEAV